MVVGLEHDLRRPRRAQVRHAFDQAAHHVQHLVVIVVVEDHPPRRQDGFLALDADIGRCVDLRRRLGGAHRSFYQFVTRCRTAPPADT